MSHIFVDIGFEYKKNKGWKKKITDGHIEVYIDFYKIKDVCNTNLYFIVSHYEVNKIAMNYLSSSNTKYNNYYTFVLTLTKWFNLVDIVFSFTNQDELDKILDKYYKKFLLENLEKYSNKYSKLEHILEVYTNPIEENYNLMNRHYDDKIISVIIAKLLDRGDFEKIVYQSKELFELLRTKWPTSMEIKEYDIYFDNMVKDLRCLKFPNRGDQ